MIEVPYGLHDAKISNVQLFNNEIRLRFREGVYKLDVDGKEISLTGACEIKLFLPNLNESGIFPYAEVFKIHKKRIREISWKSFCKMVNEEQFDIDMVYTSEFFRALMVEGYVGKFKMVLIIQEVQNIAISFNEV